MFSEPTCYALPNRGIPDQRVKIAYNRVIMSAEPLARRPTVHTGAAGDPAEAHWWRRAVIYQIYPRSFAESTPPGSQPTGVGNLRGIIDHLDHIVWLGADAIWLSPIFTSPMADFGYDVADYCDIDPIFGSLDDFDDLVAAAHLRGLRVLLDWVPNHTSDQHPWFIESRSSRDNPKADWYIWRDTPPNNWLAAFPRGDSAWKWDETRGQYYLRNFTPEQPDLNWENPDVREAMLDTLRFWLDRGVDGFRMDVIHLLGKDLTAETPTAPTELSWSHVPHNDIDSTHEHLRTIRAVLDSYPGDRVSIGEVFLLDEAKVAKYYGQGDELHLSFNFTFMWTAVTASAMRQRIAKTLAHLDPIDAWPTWVMSNHDVTRHRQRHGGDERIARMMAVLLLTLPGTPFLYQGECLGLIDAEIAPGTMVDPGNRDGCRAPIPWTGEPGHGWPTTPWLPFAPEATSRNVADMQGDDTSIMSLYRRLMFLRRSDDELVLGSYAEVEVAISDPDDQVLSFSRGGWLVMFNFGKSAVDLNIAVSVEVGSHGISAGQVITVLPPLTAVVARSIAQPG